MQTATILWIWLPLTFFGMYHVILWLADEFER